MSESKVDKSAVELIDKKKKKEFNALDGQAEAEARIEARVKKARIEAQRTESSAFVMGYAKRECCSISLGMVWLVGGLLSDLSVPIFIGRVVDLNKEEKYDDIGELCLYMIIIVVVSKQASLPILVSFHLLQFLFFYQISGACVGLRASTFNILSERIAMKVKKDYYEAIINKDVTFFDTKRTGDLCKQP